MREAAMSPDPSKPLPLDVLRTLSLGLGFENVLTVLCSEGEETISLLENDVKVVKSMTCSANEENLTKLGPVNSNDKDPGYFSILKERNIISSQSMQGLLHQEKMGSPPSTGKDACPELISGGELLSTELKGTMSPKVVFCIFSSFFFCRC